MNENWVCIGHSHALALERGAERGGVELDAINFWHTGEPWLRDGTAIRLRADLAERVGRGRPILSLVGGSAHTVLGMVEHPRPFDFVLPSAPTLPVDESVSSCRRKRYAPSWPRSPIPIWTRCPPSCARRGRP
ncbi:MAG: hypothetical protein WDN69_35515 [Aliidongia sp.]